MKSWQLSPRAERSLYEIAIWTNKHFGEQQARKYQQLLIDEIDSLASETTLQGKTCTQLLSGNADNELLYRIIGRHCIIYRETNNEVQIIDFVHGARDLPALLAKLI